MTAASAKQVDYIISLANDVEPGGYRWLNDVASHPACNLSKGQLARLTASQASDLIKVMQRWNARQESAEAKEQAKPIVALDVAGMAVAWRAAESDLIRSVRHARHLGVPKTVLARTVGVPVGQINRWVSTAHE